MRALRELQSGFDAALRGGALPQGLTARVPAEAERRFNVYRNNVTVSLCGALAARFPVIERLVGHDFFGQMARLYIDLERPSTPLLWQWGRGFPAFLEAFPPLQAYPYMADVARIEFQRGIAFHAADHSPISAEELAAADPQSLVIELHPSLAILSLDHPAVSIWSANQPGRVPGAIPPLAEIAMIYRDPSFDVPVRAITSGDTAMIGAIVGGRPLLDAAQVGLTADPTHDAPRLLHDLLAAGLITNAKA